MKHSHIDKPQNYLNEVGEFIIEDYNNAKPFSSFFPGIAGVNGIPMWVFYLNRGQCISSMGIQDKDNPIMEYLPANRAYNLVGSHGFRTFLKLSNHPTCNYYEPFQNHYRDRQLKRTQRMIIAPSQLTIEEVNHSLNLKFRVEYFNVPQDNYAGLIRTLHIENVGSDTVILDGLDGLPLIIPYGVDNFCLKNMRRTIEAFVEVSNFDNGVPFFKGKVEPDDRPDVKKIVRGNFYLGLENHGSETKIIRPIVDPIKIFGSQTDYSFPQNFLDMDLKKIRKNQILENQLPCAMGMFSCEIPPGKSYSYASIIGHASSVEKLNEMVPRFASNEYIKSKSKTNHDIIESLTQHNLICSQEPTLDHYVRQNFLDNTMRGGFPFTFNGNKKRSTIYLYSRKHGDMERDYNDFRLTPTQYSQGNGNFRDINQNRRSDLFFNPDIEDSNVEYFYNLIQLDGFNPLVLKEVSFKVDDIDKLQSVLEKYISPKYIVTVKSYFINSFTPGGLLNFLNEHSININMSSEIFLGEILSYCTRISESEHGEGFWTDHWTYNLDLLENYLAVYPDRFQNLLFKKKAFSFYDNPNQVLPRNEKFVLWEGKPMQLGSVLINEEKVTLIKNRKQNSNQVYNKLGLGEVFYTTLFIKILSLITNKLASLDPEGVGVEMEAGKPGWYDALNGLPGLFGSSVSETLEIKRHILFLMEMLTEYNVEDDEVKIYEELNEFMENLFELLNSNYSSVEFWGFASTAKENYRDKTRLGISGVENSVKIERVKEFFFAILQKLDEGILKAKDVKTNTINTYFRYEVAEYKEIEIKDSHGENKQKQNANGLACIKPLKFIQIPLPLFLEGPVHYLRCIDDAVQAKEFAQNIKKSNLYDKSLNMYKVNASLKDQPMEIGRARVFSPGWLENESIWLHMEYKYMLELLRNGLYEEFYADFKNVFIPFLDPDVYGRSILENSSFIASSANPNSSIHGNGFVARLSGATAEFIHILLLMSVGSKPFQLNSKGELQLCFNPSLPGSLFTQDERKIKLLKENISHEIIVPAKTFSFMFLGKILVTYHNVDLLDTFGDDKVKPCEWKIVDLEGKVETFKTEILSGDIVLKIRERKISRIEIKLSNSIVKKKRILNKETILEELESSEIFPREEPFEVRFLNQYIENKWIGNAVAYGCYRTGQEPGLVGPSDEELLEDLKIISQHWNLIRVYGADKDTERIIDVIDSNNLPIKVLLGIWIQSEDKEPKKKDANITQILLSIKLANSYPDIIIAISIGNETQVSWSKNKVSLDCLIHYIRVVRNNVAIPVTTADDHIYWILPESQQLAEEIDFVYSHIHPLWNGEQIGDAINWLDKIYHELHKLHSNRVIVIGETGWATDYNPSDIGEGEQGTLIKGEVNIEAQAKFLIELNKWVMSNKVTTFLFEVFDELWKGGGENTTPHEVEKNWGVFNENRSPKKSFLKYLEHLDNNNK